MKFPMKFASPQLTQEHDEILSLSKSLIQAPNDSKAWYRLGFMSATSSGAVTEALRLHALTGNVGKISYIAGLLDSDAGFIGFTEPTADKEPEPRIAIQHGDERLGRWLVASFGFLSEVVQTA